MKMKIPEIFYMLSCTYKLQSRLQNITVDMSLGGWSPVYIWSTIKKKSIAIVIKIQWSYVIFFSKWLFFIYLLKILKYTKSLAQSNKSLVGLQQKNIPLWIRNTLYTSILVQHLSIHNSIIFRQNLFDYKNFANYVCIK